MLAVIVLPSIQAQQPTTIPASQQKKKLILVVGVAPNPARRRMTSELMTSLMKSAMRKTNRLCSCEGDPLVNAISPVFYSEFSKLVDRAEGGSSEVDEGDGTGILVSPVAESLEDFPYVFRLTLKEPKKYLFKLEVKYENEVKTEVFSPSEKDIGQVTTAGTDSKNRAQYWVRLKKYPEKYIVTAKELDKPDSVYEGLWPRTSSHFAVMFREFAGDFNVLREKLLDKEIDPISEPIDEIAEFADTRFLLASVGFRITGGGNPSVKPDNQITITVRQPQPGIDAIWVKLPYNEKDIETELEPWNALKDGDSVIQKMRSETTDESMEEAPTELSSTTAPKWYRLRKAPQAKEFSRKFRLTDQPAFIRKYSPLSMGVIHQTDEGDDAVASTIGQAWVDKIVITDKDDADLAAPKDGTKDKEEAKESDGAKSKDGVKPKEGAKVKDAAKVPASTPKKAEEPKAPGNEN